MDLYHPTLRILMRTGGQLSDGIRLGYREGFNSGTMVDYVYANEAHGHQPARQVRRPGHARPPRLARRARPA